MSDFCDLHPNQDRKHGRKEMDARLQLPPSRDTSTKTKIPQYTRRNSTSAHKLSFNDLYDGFIDSRMYSCLNVGNRRSSSEKQERRYYNRNVFDSPGSSNISRNHHAARKNAEAISDPYKLRRKREKYIQDKVYYPPSDSDSASTEQNGSRTNPFVQKVPIYLYEHYDKNNKYLPKSSRKAYKCKARRDCCSKIPDCCKDHIFGSQPDDTLVFVKEPASHQSRSAPRATASAPMVVSEEAIADQKSCRTKDTCEELKERLSDLQKDYEALLEDKDDELEIKIHDISNCKSAKCSSKIPKFLSNITPEKSKVRSYRGTEATSRTTAKTKPSGTCQNTQTSHRGSIVRPVGKDAKHVEIQSCACPKKLTIQTMPAFSTHCSKICKPDGNRDLKRGGQNPCLCYGGTIESNKYYGNTMSTASSGTTGYGYGSASGSKGYDYAGYSGSDYYSGTTRTRRSKGKSRNVNNNTNNNDNISGGDQGLKPGYVCDQRTCGGTAGGLEVGYATAIVTRFSTYTVYEVLRPMKKPPPTMCRVTENVFVVKNK